MADTHYPKDPKKRIDFWTGQLKLAEEFIRPYMKAGKEIVKLYNNQTVNLREKTLDTFQGAGVPRVKGSIVFAWVDQSVANMHEEQIQFSISPKSQASVPGAPLVQKAINETYNDAGQEEEDDQMALDAHLLPYAVKKIGWHGEIEERAGLFVGDTSSIIIDDPDQENMALAEGQSTKVTAKQNHARHKETHEQFKDELLGELNLPEVVEAIDEHIAHHNEVEKLTSLPETSTNVKWETPFGSRIAPDDFLMDAFSMMGGSDARWQAFRIRQPVAWWKRQELFDNTSDLKPNSQLSIEDENRFKKNRSAEFEDFGMLEGWEIWAKNFPVEKGRTADLLVVFAQGQDKIQRHDEEWPYDHITEYPSSILRFQKNVKTWINKPTLSLAGAGSMQQLIGEFFDSMLYTIRKQKNVWIYDTTVFTKEMIQDITQAPDGSIFGVEGLSDSSGIVTLPFHAVPEEKAQYMSLLRNFFDDTAGTPQPIRSATPETATEVSIIEKRNSARENKRKVLFHRMQVDTARKFWQLYQQFQPATQYLVDPRLDKWLSVDDAIASGEYRFRIKVVPTASSRAVNRKNYSDLLNQAAGLVGLYLQLKLQPPDINEIFEDLLRHGYDISDPERILPGSKGDFRKQIELVLQDPEKLGLTVQALTALGGGGNQGVLGASPGPLDSQMFSQSPTTALRQESEANNLSGGANGR